MNVAKKKRWLRGGELLESRDIYLEEEYPQRLILSCICPIAVSDLTLFFISTCIYLHLLAHIYTLQHIHHITSRHITSHHICITLQNVSGTLCSLEDFWGFLFSLFFLATCNALDVPSLILRGVSTVFDIWFLVLRGICDILEHGRWILHFGTSTCRLARYLQHFTTKITQTIVVFLLFLRSFAAVVVVIVRVSCGSCWFVVVAVLVVVVPVAVAVGEPEIYEPNQTESVRCHADLFSDLKTGFTLQQMNIAMENDHV